MAHYFSPSLNAFFAGEFRADYEAAGTWPSDAKEVTDAVFQEFALAAVPAGKTRSVSLDKPCWVNIETQPLTADQMKALLTAAVQRHIDSQAQALGYDNIYTAVSYAEEPAVPRFQLEGRALRAWRSLVWAASREVMSAVEAGDRAVPTAEELIAALPAFEAPAAACLEVYGKSDCGRDQLSG